MAAYTRLSSDDIQDILNIYQVGELSSVEPLSLGISNSNYRCDLKDGACVILKVSNDKGVEEMKEEQRILLALKDYPYSLAPYQTRGGEGVYQWKGLYGAVFPFVSGCKPMGAPDDVSILGQALAQLHVYSIERKLETKGIRSHSLVGYDLGGIVDYCEQEAALGEFRVACEEMLSFEEKELWRASSLPEGLIHGDLYLDNALFEGGELKALLDFEQSGIGCFLQDIGISISGSCLDKEGVSFDKIQAFVEGYQKFRELERAELELLNFAITLGFLDISLWRIKRFHEGDLDPQKKDSYKELLELARSFNSRLKKSFKL